jgi:hypothetical protein
MVVGSGSAACVREAAMAPFPQPLADDAWFGTAAQRLMHGEAATALDG